MEIENIKIEKFCLLSGKGTFALKDKVLKVSPLKGLWMDKESGWIFDESKKPILLDLVKKHDDLKLNEVYGVTGNMFPYRDKLQALNCKWVPYFSAWIFNDKHKNDVEKWLENLKASFIKEFSKAIDDAEKGKTVIISIIDDKYKNLIINSKEADKILESNKQVIELADDDKRKKEKEKMKKGKIIIPKTVSALTNEPLLVSLSPRLISECYFESKILLDKFIKNTVGREGWLLYLQKKFPELCLVIDKTSAAFIVDRKIKYLCVRLNPNEEPKIKHYFDADMNKFYEAPPGFHFIEINVIKVGTLEMCDWVIPKFKECYEDNTKRFSIFVIEIRISPRHVGHANSFIYDRKIKSLYHFEPQGIDTEKHDLVALNFNITKMIDQTDLKKYIDHYIPLYKYCPKMGPQYRENNYQYRFKKAEEYEGFCVSWNSYFIHAIISNPDHTLKYIMDKLLSESDENLYKFIREYASFITSKKKEIEEYYYALK